MALATRTIYVMLVMITGLLYFLYAAYTSTIDGQLYRFTSWNKGNLTYSSSSLRSNKKEKYSNVDSNATSISNRTDIIDKSNLSVKNATEEDKKGDPKLANPVPPLNNTKDNRSDVDKKPSVIQRIPPKGDNATIDYIVQGVVTRNVYDSGFALPNVELCPDFGSQLQIAILVTSAPKHTEARMAIRQTWGHFGLRSDVVVAFLLGRALDGSQPKIQQESALYHDIVQANFVDSYNNLTLKSIAMLEWVDNYCNKAKFILKTDDDMFINIPKLLAFVSKHSKDKRKIYGRLAKKWKPIRNKASKYYVSVQQYRHSLFPDFTTGPAYVMTSDVVHDLYVTALEKTYLKLEDVYTTGIVAQEKKVQRVHVNEFFNRRVTLNPCNVQKGISIHMVKTYEQYDLWKKLLDGRSKC